MQHTATRVRVGRSLRYLVTTHCQRAYSQKNQKIIKSTSEEAVFLSGWDHAVYQSTRTTEKKSAFWAHASHLHSSSSLDAFLKALTAQPSLKRATHCMYAYRLLANNRWAVGQNDGGEKGSGDRLSKLLEMSKCENVVVVVSRWYGGIKLGSDRWKMISNVAKEALQKGGFYNHKTTETTVQPIHKKNRDEKNK
ncbi:ribosomal protein S5 domain 2-type protein [Crepidotus variabilis]|uniref:Ribosomal protein S5 domain 2-type protein n=1 Tax=Crepidotus variabilis TaxID=179855 RepID=A0A9P6E7W6_9AGAR|nr:ribosomal protein S5 domain 2-type protein [Crepidotus variabilis]